MKEAKKIAGLLGTALMALALAACLTWTTADDGAKAEIEESLNGAANGSSEEGASPIDWDSLSQEIVAWVEVPGTKISQPIVKAGKEDPNAYLYLDALGQGGYGTPYIDADCTAESLLEPIYGHNMSDGSAFADFAKYGDEEYARGHSAIDLYARDGRKHELEVFAVDIVNANAETMCPDFDDAEAIAEWVAKSDIVLAEYDGASKVFAFTTCSYQTANSRTAVYASPIGQ